LIFSIRVAKQRSKEKDLTQMVIFSFNDQLQLELAKYFIKEPINVDISFCSEVIIEEETWNINYI